MRTRQALERLDLALDLPCNPLQLALGQLTKRGLAPIGPTEYRSVLLSEGHSRRMLLGTDRAIGQ